MIDRIFHGRIALVSVAAALISLLLNAALCAAGDGLHIYGPGGPYPAMKEAGEAFAKMEGTKVDIGFGPTSKWIEKAKDDADIIYSGAEYMMTDFIRLLDGRVDESTVTPLYLRPSAILVRPGNPRQIKDLPDLLKPGLQVLVVQGAGQTGLWEDMAGKLGDIETVRSLRKNIAAYAPDSASAKQAWSDNKELDAWIIWNIWQVANPGLADLVPVSDKYVIYRDCAIALTKQGKENPLAARFIEFVSSPEGAKIFAKWGWMAK